MNRNTMIMTYGISHLTICQAFCIKSGWTHNARQYYTQPAYNMQENAYFEYRIESERHICRRFSYK